MADEFAVAPPRRRFLAAVATAATGVTAGCTGLWDQPGATDVVALSVATATRTVAVTIAAVGAADPHTTRTVTLDPGGRVDPVNRSKLPKNSDYVVEVVVDGGPREAFEWTDIQFAPLYVVVDDSSNVRFLLEAG